MVFLAKVDAPNKGESTALHRAIEADRKPLVEFLLARGTDPNRRNFEGETPLDIAQAEGEEDLAALLTARRPIFG